MADNTAVNSQITDSVTQSNAKILSEAPAMALGSVYQTMAHSLGILMENAVANQQNMSMIGQATTAQGVILIYAADSAAAAAAANTILESKK